MLPEGLKTVRVENYFSPKVQGPCFIEGDSIVDGEFQGTFVLRVCELQKRLDPRDGVVLLCEYFRASNEELDKDCRELLDNMFAVHLCGKSHEACPVYTNGLQTLHLLRVRRIKAVKKGTPLVYSTSKGTRAARRGDSQEKAGLGPAGGALVARQPGGRAGSSAEHVHEDAARVRDQLRGPATARPSRDERVEPPELPVGRGRSPQRRSVVPDRRGVGDERGGLLREEDEAYWDDYEEWRHDDFLDSAVTKPEIEIGGLVAWSPVRPLLLRGLRLHSSAALCRTSMSMSRLRRGADRGGGRGGAVEVATAIVAQARVPAARWPRPIGFFAMPGVRRGPWTTFQGGRRALLRDSHWRGSAST
jgi:hypothetical protein